MIRLAALTGVCLVLVVVIGAFAMRRRPSSPKSLDTNALADRVAAAVHEAAATEWLYARRGQIVDELTRNETDNGTPLRFAGLMVADGYVEPAWDIARRDGSRLIAFARAMSHLPDAATRLELYSYLRPLAAAKTPVDGVDIFPQAWANIRTASLIAIAQVPEREEAVRELCRQLDGDPQLRDAVVAAQKELQQQPEVFVRQTHQRYTPADYHRIADVETAVSLARGRRLFHRLECYKCHAKTGPPSPLGPSLTASPLVGKPEAIFAAIVEPDDDVDTRYQEYMIVHEGKVATGLLIENNSERVVLVTDPMLDCEPLVVDRTELEEPPEPLRTSPMPQGMVDTLRADELRDLVYYVANPMALDGEDR